MSSSPASFSRDRTETGFDSRDRPVPRAAHIANPLADPTLELHDQTHNTLLATSNDWGDGATRQLIMDTDLAPKSPSEAAIITTLPANNTAYSAIMRGVNGSGIRSRRSLRPR